MPFYHFVIHLVSGSRIHVDAPGQLGHFGDQKRSTRMPGATGYESRLPRDRGPGVY
jgi:hypothetical protein